MVSQGGRAIRGVQGLFWCGEARCRERWGFAIQVGEAGGIQFKRPGADLIGPCPCPCHDDYQPSLVISRKKNLWHCLGPCRAGGSVIDWVMRSKGMSLRHAVELLGADQLSSGSNGAPPKQSTVRKLAPPIQRGADDCQMLLEVLGSSLVCDQRVHNGSPSC